MNEEFDILLHGDDEAKKNEKMKLTIGYIRTSTPQQHFDRQRTSIKEAYPDAILMEEAYTGTSFERPVWKKVLRQVKKGDVKVIVFDEVSRMSRDAKEGFAMYKLLMSYNVELVFLREPHINTEVYKQAIGNQINIQVQSGDQITDEFMANILNVLNDFTMKLVEKNIELAFERSQAEVDYLRERTKAGMRAAKIRGSQIGSKIISKKSIKAKKQILKYYKIFGKGTLNIAECLRLCHITRQTFYKYVEELIAEGYEMAELGEEELANPKECSFIEMAKNHGLSQGE